MIKRLLTLIVSLAVALTAYAGAGKFADISHADLKSAISSGKVTLIDVNGSKSYSKAHIPGAIDFAVAKENLAARLPSDKDALIVAYCGGPKCGAYKQAAEAAVALGYRNVKHYSGGISGWTERGEPTGKQG